MTSLRLRAVDIQGVLASGRVSEAVGIAGIEAQRIGTVVQS
jgi:hypothetical protein